MDKGTFFDLGSSLIVSGMGLLIVMGVLAILAIAIVVLSKFVSTGKKKSENEKPAVVASPQKAQISVTPKEPEIDEEVYAVLLVAVSDACGLPLKSFQITSIKEVG